MFLPTEAAGGDGEGNQGEALHFVLDTCEQAVDNAVEQSEDRRGQQHQQ